MNILLCGYKNVGKSLLGREVAKITKLNFVDLDEEIEKSHKISARALFLEKGEAFFRREEFAILSSLKIDNSLVSLGGGTLLLPDSCRVAKEIGSMIYLKADVALLRRRFIETKCALSSFEKSFKERESSYQIADYTFMITGNYETDLVELSTLVQGMING